MGNKKNHYLVVHYKDDRKDPEQRFVHWEVWGLNLDGSIVLESGVIVKDLEADKEVDFPKPSQSISWTEVPEDVQISLLSKTRAFSAKLQSLVDEDRICQG